MATGNTRESWGTLHRGLHWLVAAAVIAQIWIGYVFNDLADQDPERARLFGIHATLGLSILLVMLVRLWSRLSNPVPALPDTLRPIEKRIARATHWLFYVLLIGMPLGGWIMVSASGGNAPFYGLALPRIAPESEALAGIVHALHVWGATLLGLLVILHVLAALRHEFLLRDGTLRRMLGMHIRPRG